MRFGHGPGRCVLGPRVVLELAGQYGADLALTGHGGDICRAASAMINAEKQEQEPTAAEALGVYLAAVSVCNTKLARYMASVIERAGDQAAREVDPATWKIARRLLSPFTATMTWGFPPTLLCKNRHPARCSTCCPRISRSSAT